MRLLAVLFLVKILAAIGLADRIEELLRSVDDPVKNRLPVTPATKVIDATCGAYQRLTLNNDTIIRFSTAGFPSSPYPGSNCSATFFFNTTGFFVFEHLNLAVQDSISFSGPEDKSFSGNEWFSNSAFFYPSSPQGQIEVNVSLAVASQYQTAGFRLWVYPYAAGAAPLLCNDKKFCSESQMVFSPGFPYGNNFNVTGYEVHVPVNNNAYRYVISNLALQDSTLNLGDATPTGSVTTPKDNAATCNGAGYYEYDFVVNFTRPTGASNEYFVVAVQSNNNPAMATPSTTIYLKAGMTEPTKVATNDRGTLYDACLTQQINVGMDAAVNASDYSIGTWMEYFDSDPADSISIDYQDSQDAMLGLILKMLYQWLPKGQVVDPDLQSYGDNWDLFDHTRFLSSGTTASSFTFTSDPAINGAGGLFYAMAFVKKFKDTLTVKKAPVEVRTPGYPYGYATGAKANYTFYGEKDQVLRLCIEDYGSTFSGLDTNRGSLLIYAGADASPSNFIRSFETENDMQYGCAYTYTPGDPMFVVFRVPETIVTKTITLGSLTLPPITVPIFIGGRVTSDSQSHSLGFRFSVSNVAPMAPPTVTDSAPSLSTSFFSLILAAGFVFFML